ncbi:MAG: hypothetical protein AAGH64_11215, partial [Planctomycetota bacterium]
GLTAPATVGGTAARARASGSGGASASADADSDTNAGPLGAFRVTIELDATTSDLPTFNDTILEWLRDEDRMAGNRYRIVGVPTIESVPVSTVRAPGAGSGPRPGGGPGGPVGGAGRSTSGAGGGGGGGGGSNSASLGGSRSMGDDGGGGGGRRAPGSPGGGFGDATLDGMAPLDFRPHVFADADAVFRYTLTYFVQRLDEPFDPDAGASSGTGGAGDSFDDNDF